MIPSLTSLKEELFDEKKCINFLFNKKIIKKIRICPICNSQIYRDHKMFKCRNRECNHSVSIFSNTFFSRNQIHCSDVMLIGYLWLNKSNHTMIQKTTGFSQNTITKYIKLLRDLIIENLDDNDEIIGGRGVVVEIDESMFTNRKGENGIWIIGGVERTLKKKCFFKIVKNRDKKTIRDIVRKHVGRSFIVMTDQWKGYHNLQKLNVRHFTVNHSKNFVDRRTGAHTNNIEATWSALKSQIRTRNRTEDLINDYLLEFIWRRKHKNHLWRSFLDAIRQINNE